MTESHFCDTWLSLRGKSSKSASSTFLSSKVSGIEPHDRHAVLLTTSHHPLTPLTRSLLSSLFLYRSAAMGVQFGSFNSICQTAALVICPLVGTDQGIEPTCYSRNVDIAGTLIFQPCESSGLAWLFWVQRAGSITARRCVFTRLPHTQS